MSALEDLRALALRDLDAAIAEVERGLEAVDPTVRQAARVVAIEVGLGHRVGALPSEEPVARAEGSAPGPHAADLARFLHRFSGREGVHARQWWDGARGGYTPIRAPLTPAVLSAHLDGTITAGVYPIRVDGTAVWLCLDLDVRKEARDVAARDRDVRVAVDAALAAEGLRIQAALLALGVPALLEDSGYKGRHLWVWLERPLEAELVHRFSTALARAVAPDDPRFVVEAFPRQGKVDADGLGNLVKLPLGIHRRSGRWSTLLDAAGPITDPWPVLHAHPVLGRDAVMAILTTLRDRVGPSLPSVVSADPRPVPEDAAALAAVLRGCPVVAALGSRIAEHRRCTYDERIVLRHAIGHLEAGAAWYNDLMRRCPEVPPRDLIQRILRGNPISCPSVRHRLPGLTATVPCHCLFDTLEGYPSPALHRAVG